MRKLVMLGSLIVRRINYVLMCVATCLLIAVTLATVTDVIMRYFFDSPIVGMNQLCEYSMVWLCFLGTGWVLTIKGHVAITLLEGILFHKSKVPAKWYLVFVDIACLCYTLPLLYLTGRETWVSFRDGIVLSGELGGVPEGILYFWVCVGFFCLSAQLIVNILGNILGMESMGGAQDSTQSN